MRLGDFLAVLHALGGAAVRHDHHVGTEHFELVFIGRVGGVLHARGAGHVGGANSASQVACGRALGEFAQIPVKSGV